MTTYILRADDREWQLSSKLAREIRIEAFNILFREDIMQGTVWSQRASRKNGMRALWVIDISYESFSKAVPTPTDPPIEWKKLTHAMAYDAWDDGIVIDKELFEEDNIRKLLDEGIGCIEVCGAFGPEDARKVAEATEGKIPVGYITHLPEQEGLHRAVFGS